MVEETTATPLSASGGSEDTSASEDTGTASEDTLTKTEETTGLEGNTEEQFMDPKDLPDELKPHFKRMQGSFTKKMQAAKDLADKAAIVDEYNSDPVGFTRKLAQQHGLNVAAGSQNSNDGDGSQQQDFNPGTWDEVYGNFEKRMAAYLDNHFAPVLNEVKGVKQKQIEQILDEEAPEWREYEDDMIQTLQTHPTLANDTRSLIRMVIPQEVIDGRAMQKALKRLEEKGKAAQVNKGSSVQKPVKSATKGNPSFAEAVQLAKASL